ncbi:MAG: DUF3486 family protein [Verrucomicrobiae bacterium]|nr:DUF3486 family protein [Verrucomicrobiae bacterium]
MSLNIKKRRGDAVLDKLAPEVQVELARFGEGHTLDETLVWLRERGVKISRTALANWLEGRRARELQERILRSIASGAEMMRQCEKEYGKNPAPSVEALIKLFRVLVMQLASAGAADPEFLRVAGPMMGQVLEAERLAVKRQELILEERRVAVLERRAAQADAAQGVVQDAGLSAEEKMQRMREIFGLSVK